jgi:hypothetical protein
MSEALFITLEFHCFTNIPFFLILFLVLLDMRILSPRARDIFHSPDEDIFSEDTKTRTLLERNMHNHYRRALACTYIHGN